MASLVAGTRVTADGVKEIIDTDKTDAQINNFINAAHLLVVQQDLSGAGLAEELLVEIERWLSAHFLAIFDQRVHKESVGGEWSAEYQGKTTMGLEATTYGQQALALDISGGLAVAGLKKISLEVYSYVDQEAGGRTPTWGSI